MDALRSVAERLEGALAGHPWGRRALFAIAFAVLLVARLPERFLRPFFYAEEGPLYFHYAWHHTPLEALASVKLGYFMAWTNLATTLAAHAVPLEYAPVLTTLMGAAIWVLLGVLVCSPSGPLRSHTARLVLLVLLFVIPPHGGKTHTSFVQYYLGFAAVLVLVSDPRTAAQRWLLRGSLVLACLNGTQCLFVAPLFALRWLLGGRAREVAVQSGLVALCGGVQVGVFLWALEHTPEQISPLRFTAFEPLILSSAVTLRSLVEPFAGLQAVEWAGGGLRALFEGQARGLSYYGLGALVLAGAPLVVALIAGPRGLRSRSSLLLAGSYLLICAISLSGAITNQEGTKSALLTAHARYFVAPNMILALALVLHATAPTPGRWRTLYRALLAWVLAVGLWSYSFEDVPRLVNGPDWRSEVAAWRADPGFPLRTWPPGWSMRLRPRDD